MDVGWLPSLSALSFMSNAALLAKHERAESFRNVIRIAVHDTRRLPAQEVASFVGALPLNAIEVRAPARAPSLVVALAPQVDGKVDPVARRCDLKLAVSPDFIPVRPQKHFDDVAVPEFIARSVVLRREKNVQARVGTDEQQVQVGIRPEAANLGGETGVITPVRAIHDDGGGGSPAP